jgi:UDP-N-acetylmuramoylalanine--D-glutamate ligase
MELKNKHITVVGLGVTGEAVARFLIKRGAIVTVTDSGSGDQIKKTAEKLKSIGVLIEIGRHNLSLFYDTEFIVLSPGVPHTTKHLNEARSRGIPVLGEIELACRFISEPIIAVTGTNGKTTATTLLGEMLINSGKETFVGGNIGNPLIAYVDSEKKADCLVVELSSFQLDTIQHFRPDVAVLLNITDDHMDRYPNFKAYVDSKARIFENQTSDDIAVLNGFDHVTEEILSRIKAKKAFFYQKGKASVRSKYYALIEKKNVLSKPCISVHMGDSTGWMPDLSEFKPVGIHNLENVSAAILAALAAGATKEGIDSTLKKFKGLEHRLEKVATVKGIEFINDSKATNTDAVAKAMEAFEQPQIVIMGGRDKDSDFQRLRSVVRKHVKHMILIGESAEKIYGILSDIVDAEFAVSMKDAVLKAFKASAPGDVVLLAPGCASFDMYANYKERGRAFRRAVQWIDSWRSP